MASRNLKSGDTVLLGDTISLRVRFDDVPPEPVTAWIEDADGTTSAAASRVGSTLEYRASFTTRALGQLEHTWYTAAPATVVDGFALRVVAPAVPAS